MNSTDRLHYNHVRSGGTAYYKQPRGLIAVHGGEAVKFLDGLITNDVKTLADGGQVLAAFPNAQGRLIAVSRLTRQVERYLFETEDATRQAIFDTLHKFTAAGDFFVEDLTETYKFVKVFDRSFIPITPPLIEFDTRLGTDYFVHTEDAPDFIGELKFFDATEVSDALLEVLRIESGTAIYGVDMDETTIVPELGLDGLISYTKGCYIGQEIIARIHFRGHIAKQLTGLVIPEKTSTDSLRGVELTAKDGKKAGRITSITVSPKLDKTIALAYVRYDYLSDGTELMAGDFNAKVTNLPFVR